MQSTLHHGAQLLMNMHQWPLLYATRQELIESVGSFARQSIAPEGDLATALVTGLARLEGSIRGRLALDDNLEAMLCGYRWTAKTALLERYQMRGLTLFCDQHGYQISPQSTPRVPTDITESIINTLALAGLRFSPGALVEAATAYVHRYAYHRDASRSRVVKQKYWRHLFAALSSEPFALSDTQKVVEESYRVITANHLLLVPHQHTEIDKGALFAQHAHDLMLAIYGCVPTAQRRESDGTIGLSMLTHLYLQARRSLDANHYAIETLANRFGINRSPLGLKAPENIPAGMLYHLEQDIQAVERQDDKLSDLLSAYAHQSVIFTDLFCAGLGFLDRRSAVLIKDLSGAENDLAFNYGLTLNSSIQTYEHLLYKSLRKVFQTFLLEHRFEGINAAIERFSNGIVERAMHERSKRRDKGVGAVKEMAL